MKFYFNTKFDTYATRKGTDTYMKISCDTEINGMFSVYVVKQTGRVAVQSFHDTTNDHLYGLTDTNHYEETKFFTDIINTLDQQEKDAFSIAFKQLGRAFKNHLTKNNMNMMKQVDIYREIRELNKRYNDAISGKPVVMATQQTAAPIENEWQNIDDIVGAMKPEVLNEITGKLMNDTGFVTVDGKDYRVFEDSTGKCTLQYRVSGANTQVHTNTPSVAKVVEKVRNSRKMAFMEKADGLTEFVNGRFYQIKNMESDFITLVSETGDSRDILRNRVSVINVFTEAPFEKDEKQETAEA